MCRCTGAPLTGRSTSVNSGLEWPTWTLIYTRLAGPESGTYYQLLVIIDLYSRYVVGWITALPTPVTWPTRSSSRPAKALLPATS